jgi:predicted DNA-binding protein
MASPVTLRLDPEIRRRVARIARRRATSTSQVLREAITSWLEREEKTGSAYESMKHFVGIVQGGDPALSANTGRRLTELFQARRNRR